MSTSHLPTIMVASVSARRVGIDVVDLEHALPTSFTKTWFGVEERAVIAGRPPGWFWAAKEAAYKALCRREAFFPRQWSIASVDAAGRHCEVVNRGRAIHVYFQQQLTFGIAIASLADCLPTFHDVSAIGPPPVDLPPTHSTLASGTAT